MADAVGEVAAAAATAVSITTSTTMSWGSWDTVLLSDNSLFNTLTIGTYELM